MGFASEWSHEISVTPDGGKANGKVKIQCIVSDGTKSIIQFKPVDKATGYSLETTDGRIFNITSAQSGFYTVEGDYKESDLRLKVK